MASEKNEFNHENEDFNIEDDDQAEEVIFGSECDLHQFPAKYTDLVVREFLRQAEESGLKNLRLIHGKGRSQKKIHVYKILSSHPAVESFGDQGSNWGATLIRLKD